MRLRACAPVRLRAFTVNGPEQEQAIIPRAGLPDRPARAHAPAHLFIMKQASVGIRVRRIPCASSYYKLPDWIPSRIIPRSPRAGAPGRLLPAQDSVCV